MTRKQHAAAVDRLRAEMVRIERQNALAQGAALIRDIRFTAAFCGLADQESARALCSLAGMPVTGKPC
jgi:hypothetical protein